MNRKSSAKPKKPLQPFSKKRLAEFAALGIRPASTFKPKAPKAAMPKRAKYTGPDDETVLLILARDQWRCTCCGDPIYGDRGSEWSVSHRKLKAHGVDNRPSNTAIVCGDGVRGCHGMIHAHPERARAAGWMLLSTEEPTAVPMEHAVHGTVLLLDDGSWVKYEEASA